MERFQYSVLKRFVPALWLGLGLMGTAFGQSVPVVHISEQPFSADLVVNRVPAPNVRNELTLQITRIYRDSWGRTRIDVPTPTSPASTPFVNIYDSVAGVNYQLDAKNKTARRFVIPGFQPGTANPTPEGSPAGTVSGFCKFPPCPGSASESLGIEFIDGLSAEGKRITSVQAGADQHRMVVESWYSRELRLILLQKESSPQGESTTRVENLNRAEPDPLLFQMPPDYTVIDVQPNVPAVSK